ncbi:hypothetical protein [Pontibacillus sp. HMF3514]|uniref:hypothetical protein n=1 Tax=Pontibacillus sp. HMF3514 TaxID=2692425 RepID=UPI00131F7CCB|nr:hypothetical protein [Pontibacillus sp. HMF3514]QHE52876.1 hypothetical protein GS400_12955 [Pontibacillus sp. HMF3514]
MKTKALLIGTEEMIESVNRIRDDFPGFNFIPLVVGPNMKQILQKFQSDGIDCAIVIHPLSFNQNITEMFNDIPVYELRYSITALYKTLFKSVLTSTHEAGSIKLSVDVFYEEKMIEKLQNEGIQNTPLYIKEHPSKMKPKDLLDFHLKSIEVHNVKTIVTSHPAIVDALRDYPVEVDLVTPTDTCVREFLYELSHKIKVTSFSEFPIRYESDKAIEHFKKQGVSGATIYKLRCLCQSIGRNNITAAELSKGFAITLRSARRILTTLENQKVAKVVGEEQLNGRGRPRNVYHIDFDQMNEEVVPAAVIN